MRPGEKQKNYGHDGRGGKLRHLALRPRAFHHSGLRRASVDNEGPTQPGHGVGCGKSGKIGVFVQFLLMTRRIDPGRCRTLGDDHHRTRCGNGKQWKKIAPTHFGKLELRETARDRSNDRNPMAAKVPHRARRMAPATAISAPGTLGAKR